VTPEGMLPPVIGQAWGYRNRARLSVRYVTKKGESLVGFRENKSTYVANIQSCEVLAPAVSRLIPELRALFTSMSIRERIPQLEIAVGENVIVFVLRHLVPVPDEDAAKLRDFADRHGIQWWLQPQGPDSVRPFHPLDAPALDYRLPEFGITLGFGPTDFTQVNAGVNRVLVRRAVDLLDPQPGERVGDLFCGVPTILRAARASSCTISTRMRRARSPSSAAWTSSSSTRRATARSRSARRSATTLRVASSMYRAVPRLSPATPTCS